MNKQRIGEYQVQKWLRAEAEREATQLGHAIPEWIRHKAMVTGFRWGAIALALLLSAWLLDGALGIHILTPIDVTKLQTYFIPDRKAFVVTPQFENDSTFTVRIPVAKGYCRVAMVMPKNQCVVLKSIINNDALLPNVSIKKQRNTRIRTGKHGGYIYTNENGSPNYVHASDLAKPEGLLSRFVSYGGILVMLDKKAQPTYEGIPFKSHARQDFYVGVNIKPADSLYASGFYQLTFQFIKKCRG
ncbi:MAG: hypothetical protein IPH75_15985 [bacterium]|nr:hypothetical protein [bacterium]